MPACRRHQDRDGVGACLYAQRRPLWQQLLPLAVPTQAVGMERLLAEQLALGAVDYARLRNQAQADERGQPRPARVGGREPTEEVRLLQQSCQRPGDYRLQPQEGQGGLHGGYGSSVALRLYPVCGLPHPCRQPAPQRRRPGAHRQGQPLQRGFARPGTPAAQHPLPHPRLLLLSARLRHLSG